MFTITTTTDDFEEALVKSLRPLRARPSASFIAQLASMPSSRAIAGTAAVVVTSATIAAGKTTATIGSFATSVGGVATSVAAVGMSVGIALTVAHHQPGPRQDAVTQVAVDRAVAREEPLDDPPSNPRKSKVARERSEVESVQVVPAIATDLEIAPDLEIVPDDEHDHDVASLAVSSSSLVPPPRAEPQARPRSSTTLTEAEEAHYIDIVTRWKGGLETCKRAARQRGAVDVAGVAKIKLRIGADGHVETVGFNSKTIRDKELIACSKRNIKRWRFEANSEPILFDFLLGFAP